MKKVLMALLAVLALASCKKEAPEHPQEKAPTKDEFVELSIGGELSQEAKALTLIPGRNDQNKAILSPKFMGQNTVRAHYFVYDNSGNFIHGVIDLGIQNGGKTFRYDGRDINVGGISTPRYLSVYLGFDDAGKFTNSEYAAIYREDQPVSINVAFKSEHNLLDERPNSIRNLNLKFDLIGSLVRTKVYNKTLNNFSATGIVASGFGNKGLSIRNPQPSATPPTNYKRPWLTADSNDAHEFKFRSSTIVEGLTIALTPTSSIALE